MGQRISSSSAAAVVEEAGCRESKRTSNSFDFLKIWAKSLKIRTKFLKIWEKSLKMWAKSGHKWRPTLLDFKKWRPTFAEKHTKTSFFFENHTKNRFSSSSWEKICRQKTHKTFRASLGKFSQKSFAPPKICLLDLYLCAAAPEMDNASVKSAKWGSRSRLR